MARLEHIVPPTDLRSGRTAPDIARQITTLIQLSKAVPC
jgi:hypothetical protein